MPQPNYAFQKRQRDLAKKQKKEEKKLKKSGARDPSQTDEVAGDSPAPAPDSDKAQP